MDAFCYSCQIRKGDGRYPVLDSFEAWGGKTIGYDCEQCAELKFDMYQESLVEG